MEVRGYFAGLSGLIGGVPFGGIEELVYLLHFRKGKVIQALMEGS